MKNDEEEDDDEGNESEAEGAQLLNVGTGDPSISEVRKKRTAARKVMPKMEDLSSQLRTQAALPTTRCLCCCSTTRRGRS